MNNGEKDCEGGQMAIIYIYIYTKFIDLIPLLQGNMIRKQQQPPYRRRTEYIHYGEAS